MPADPIIVDRSRLDAAQRAALPVILREAFHGPFSFYQEPGAAEREVRPLTEDGDRRLLAAVDGAGRVLGWIGGIVHDPPRWELHPLCVRPDDQRCGLGTMLVRALEHLARAEGATVMFLGTEDETGATTLFGVDPYPDVAGALASLRVTGRHPILFYESLGYRVTGLIPHAVGFGKHDFIMCRQL